MIVGSSTDKERGERFKTAWEEDFAFFQVVILPDNVLEMTARKYLDLLLFIKKFLLIS